MFGEPLDGYAVARYVAHYRRKNDYDARVDVLGLSSGQLALLEHNGVIELVALAPGAKRVIVRLTAKGLRMASEPRPSRPTTRRRPTP
jgi:hypothetical protein